MNYNDCKKNLLLFKSNDEIGNNIENEYGTIDEIFIASSDFKEMNDDLKNIHENEYGLSEIIPLSTNGNYEIYVLTEGGLVTLVDAKFFELDGK
jgi:hypothetical protein